MRGSKIISLGHSASCRGRRNIPPNRWRHSAQPSGHRNLQRHDCWHSVGPSEKHPLPESGWGIPKEKLPTADVAVGIPMMQNGRHSQGETSYRAGVEHVLCRRTPQASETSDFTFAGIPWAHLEKPPQPHSHELRALEWLGHSREKPPSVNTTVGIPRRPRAATCDTRAAETSSTDREGFQPTPAK